jgi:threonine dehydrogenase-like Zn-dependent dehydrogenase
MKALRVEKRGIAVREVETPERDDEALVRVILSGICNTDLEIARGYAGFRGTIGHEFVGVIESLPSAGAEARPLGRAQDPVAPSLTAPPQPSRSAGDSGVGPLQVGQRVVGEINAGCGNCDLCRAGDSRHCPGRTVLGIVGRDGAHAEYLRLPLRNLLPVPAKIADEHAVFTEPLAAAWGITERVQITSDTRVAVIGDGKLGLLCAQALALTGAPLLLVGKHAEKLRIAERRGIETATIKKAEKRKREFDLVVEASGGASGFALALNLLQPRGTLVLKSTFHGATEMDTARLVVDEISIVGSRCGRFAPALDLLKKGAIDLDSLISEEYPLAKGVLAMDRASKKGVLKVLLRP